MVEVFKIEFCEQGKSYKKKLYDGRDSFIKFCRYQICVNLHTEIKAYIHKNRNWKLLSGVDLQRMGVLNAMEFKIKNGPFENICNLEYLRKVELKPNYKAYVNRHPEISMQHGWELLSEQELLTLKGISC